MILIEDAFIGVEITDNDADQTEVVGDLIRHIEGNNQQRGQKRSQRVGLNTSGSRGNGRDWF
jgi:hypothetical protein